MTYSACDLADDVYGGLIEAGLLPEDEDTSELDIAEAFQNAMSERSRLLVALKAIVEDATDEPGDFQLVSNSDFFAGKRLLERIEHDAEAVSETREENEDE